MPSRAAYLNYIHAAGEHTESYLEHSITSWRDAFDPHNALFGYSASGAPAAAAAIDAFIYQQMGEQERARRARDALLLQRELTGIFPPEIAARHPEYHRAVPPMDGLFIPPIYIPAYERIRTSDVFTSADHQAIASIVADSLHTLFHFPEWGAHNRAMLRALSLALAARAFPEQPEARGWRELSDQLAHDSWGRWTIEDAMGYHSVWMLALFTYAEVADRPDFHKLPATHYYMTYFAHMLTPLDTFPDFGDCNWGGGAERLLPCFEKAAAVSGDPELKYVADAMFRQMVESGPPTIDNALLCIQAYDWADDSIRPERPDWQSEELLDDLVGKKILFRSGSDPDATYMLLNYRDELGYGSIPRRYLRTTLAVSAEKMHHGHADENALILLLDKGAVLLHDGGYRETLPNGRYRADIYHNRVIWRPGIKRADTSAWDFLHNDGSYRVTRTEKLHFASFKGLDLSRTRLIDEERGVAWERIVAYLKALDCFILVDVARALRTMPLTLANILYTSQIHDTGAGYFDTSIDKIGTWRNPQRRHLLIAYPLIEHRPVSVEPIRRHYQQETGLFQIWTGHLTQGDIVPFATVLWPHAPTGDPASLANALSLLEISKPDHAIAIRIETADHTATFGCRLDLDLGLLSEDIRPRYSYGAGHIRYGEFETDANHFYADATDGQLQVAFTEGTRLFYRDMCLYEGEAHRMFQEDASNRGTTPSWREYWQHTFTERS
jgi:hypothetical protein